MNASTNGDRKGALERVVLVLGLSLPFLFYFLSCSRTIGGTDSAELIELMATNRITSHVSSHNLTIVLGHLFTLAPWGELAFRCNLVSVLVEGLALASYFLLLRSALADGVLALLLSAVLMVSHSVWWHGTTVESYAVNALFTVLTIGLLLGLERTGRDRYLLALFALSGLAFFNHISMGILLVAASLALVVRTFRSRHAWLRRALLSGAAFGLGFLPYAWLLARDALRGGDLSASVHSAVGGEFTSMMFEGEPTALRSFFEWVGLQFPSPFLLFVPWGIAAALADRKQRWVGIPLLAAAAVNVGFFMSFVTWDQFAFYLPTFVILAWFGALGVFSFRRRLRTHAAYAVLCLVLAASTLPPPYLYARLASSPRTAHLAIGWHFDNQDTRNLFDWGRFVADPNKRSYDDIARFSELALAKIPDSALLFDDDGRTFGPLRYYQKRLGRRPDLKIEVMNSWGLQEWGVGPERVVTSAQLHPGRVFVVSDMPPYDRPLAALRQLGYRVERFDLSAERWLYEVVSPRARSSAVPGVAAIRTGTDLGGPGRREKDSFDRAEPVMAELLFSSSAEPAPFYLEWRAPNGETFTNEAGVIPAGAFSIAAPLPLEPRSRPRGRWEVSAVSRGSRLKTVAFMLF